MRFSKPPSPTWRGVGEEEPRPTAWDGARRALAAKTTTPSPPAHACSVGGWLVFHGAKRARVARHGIKRDTTTFRSRSRRPGAVSVKRSLGQRRGMERVARWPAKTTTPSPPARACSVGGWPVLHEAKRARAARHGSQRRWPLRFEAAAADLARCRRRRASANGVGWSASRVGREDNHAKSASARVLRGQSAGSPRGEARAGRAPRSQTRCYDISKSQPPTWRGVGEEEPRPTAWGGARRALAAKTTTPSLPARPCTVRSAGSPRGEARAGCAALESNDGHDVPKLQPPPWRGVGEEEPRPIAWGGARRALAAKTTTPSRPAHACSAGGWPVLYGAKRARAVRHGSQPR